MAMYHNGMARFTLCFLAQAALAAAQPYDLLLSTNIEDVVAGVKTAHWEDGGWTAVERALEAGRLAGKPLMAGFGRFRAERPSWRLADEMPRPGEFIARPPR